MKPLKPSDAGHEPINIAVEEQSHAFDQKPGDLFVVRVAGNFVTSERLGSLEFGSAVLGTKLVTVPGTPKAAQ